ncbi:MAG TPA: septation protein A [Rugosibacter sp.]|nr:septation protein A [Rugosibacter sp.]HQQ36068.1 septation protein A [Rugosibacter sp.]
MKFLFDLLPIFLFFSAFKYYESHKEAAAELLNTLFSSLGFASGFLPSQSPILVATLVVMVATALQIAYVRLRHGKVDAMLWISLILVTVFGGLTLVLHDETFIKWKPTLLDWLFTLVLLISARFFNRNLIRAMMEKQVQLPERLWRNLNYAWAAFFAFMGVLNLYIAFNFSTDIWVNFKLFGGIGLMLLFVLAQGIFLTKHMPQESS